MAVKKKVAKKPTAKTVALTVTLQVDAAAGVREVARCVRDALVAFKPRVTPIKEA